MKTELDEKELEDAFGKAAQQVAKIADETRARPAEFAVGLGANAAENAADSEQPRKPLNNDDLRQSAMGELKVMEREKSEIRQEREADRLDYIARCRAINARIAELDEREAMMKALLASGEPQMQADE